MTCSTRLYFTDFHYVQRLTCIKLTQAIVEAGEADIEVSLDSDAEIEVVPKKPTRGKAAGKMAGKKPAAAGRGAKASTFSTQ